MLAIPRRAGLLALWVAILGSASAGELDPKSTKRLALAQEKAEKLKFRPARRIARKVYAQTGAVEALEAAVQIEIKELFMAVQILQGMGVMEIPEGFEPLARVEASIAELQSVAPNSVSLAVARGALQQLFGAALLEVIPPPCAPGVDGLYQRAEVAFAAGDRAAALTLYDAALEQCPTHSVLWTWSGDAVLYLSGPRAAIGRYRKAVEVDACNHVAWRFIADTTFALPDQDPADLRLGFNAAVRAVACNPSYGEGWSTLSRYVDLIGGELMGEPLGKMDRSSLRTLLTAADLRKEDSVMARRTGAFHELQSSQDGVMFNILGMYGSEPGFPVVLAWETLDAEVSAEFRAARVQALPMLESWILSTRVRTPDDQ